MRSCIVNSREQASVFATAVRGGSRYVRARVFVTAVLVVRCALSLQCLYDDWLAEV